MKLLQALTLAPALAATLFVAPLHAKPGDPIPRPAVSIQKAIQSATVKFKAEPPDGADAVESYEVLSAQYVEGFGKGEDYVKFDERMWLVKLVHLENPTECFYYIVNNRGGAKMLLHEE